MEMKRINTIKIGVLPTLLYYANIYMSNAKQKLSDILYEQNHSKLYLEL